MRSQVEISVLVPVYNVERYLKQCLESIISQTMKNIEVICIDDGSTDRSGKILDEYACADSRIRVIHKKNTGYGHSMNVGLNSARGNYIAILESDDFAEADMLECLFKYAVSSQADIVKANFYNYINGKDELNERLAWYPAYQLVSYKNCPALMKIADSIWSALYKKEFLVKNNILFNETPGASFQDTSFAAICWLFAERVYLVNEAVLHYRMDNVDSSIHASGKVFCICDEWSRVEKELDKYPEKKEIVKGYEIAMKYQGYLFNYFRLSACYQYALLVRIQEELLEDEKQGFLEKKCFEPAVWEQVTDIIADREQFFLKTAKAIQDERMEKTQTKNKEVYYNAFINEIKKYPSVIIYGAGKIGREVADALQKENIEITCFAVSDIGDKPHVYMGIKVEQILNLSGYTEESAVIVAVGDRYQYEIYNILRQYKFKNIFLIDKMLRDGLK